MVWTDENIDELKKLWQKGMTTSEIAKQLGVSKNSVVGKVHRIGLTSRPSPIKIKSDEAESTSSQSAKKKSTKVSAPSDIHSEKEAAFNQPVDDKSAEAKKTNTQTDPSLSPSVTKLTDLDSHTCRWPIGDPKDENFHFCGKKIRTGQTYCEEHAAIAYVRR